MDRTREFLQIAREKGEATGPKKVNKSVKTKSAFQDAAAEIARGIHNTSGTLSKLAKLVKRQGLFDDPTEEINALIFRIKQDLDELNSKCDSAQQYVDGQKSARNGNVQGQGQHHLKVVGQLKSGLMDTTKTFKNVLEMRTNKVKDQQTRKKALTGSGILSPIKQNQSLVAPPPSMHSQSQKNNNQYTSESLNGNNLPQEQNRKAQFYNMTQAGTQQPGPYSSSMTEEEMSGQYSSINDSTNVYSSNYNNGGNNNQDMEQQLLLAPPTQYFELREKAVGEVESTIAELGTLFKRLTNMIAEQGDLVERIDEDIESSVAQVDSARDVLQKMYDSASSNSSLYMKLGAIFTLFIIFFTVFLM